MRLRPVYVTDPNLVDEPLIDVPNQWAPQQGIHLYHFPLSLDSQKVRQGLEELEVQWQSHPILLSAHQQFSPSYVRTPAHCIPHLVVDLWSVGRAHQYDRRHKSQGATDVVSRLLCGSGGQCLERHAAEDLSQLTQLRCGKRGESAVRVRARCADVRRQGEGKRR